MFLFMLNNTLAQTQVSGTILDSLSQKPLPNASIHIKNKAGIAIASTSSNNKGNFSVVITTTGDFTLITDYIGYESASRRFTIAKDLGGELKFDIGLSLANINLKDVKIVNKVSKPFILFTGGKIILNVSQSPLTAGDDAYSVLLRAPGVVELDGTLIFRNKTINVLIDGKPTHLTDAELKNMLSSMPANGIERVEIISNPSAKYDAAGGSVINIISAKNKRDGLNGVYSTGIGTGKYIKYNEGINLNYRDKGLNVYGSYDFMHNKQYYDNRSNRIIDQTASVYQTDYEVRSRFNNSYKIGVDYDLTRNSTIGILLKGYTNYGKRTVGNQSDLRHITGGDSSSLGNTAGNVKFTNPLVSITYTKKIDSLGKELSVSGDYFNYHKYWNDNFSTNYFDANGSQFLPTTYFRNSLPGTVSNYSFSIDYAAPSKIGKFEYGIRNQFTTTDNDAKWENLINDDWINDATKTNHFIYRENINAAYVNYTNTFQLKYTITVGLRAEQTNTKGELVTGNQINDNHYLKLFPNINFNYTPGVDNEFALTYRKSIDRFGLNIVNPFVIYQNQYSLSQGNPGILPQINNNFEFTYTLKRAFVLGASYTHTTDPLVPVYIKGPDNIVISTYNNLKAADLFYVYYDLTFPITKWWTTDLSGGTGFYKYNTSSSLFKGNNSTWSYLLQTENTFNFGNGWAAELNVLDRGPYASGIYKLQTILTTSTGVSKNLAHNKANIKLALLDIFNTERQKVNINYQDLVINQNNKTETRFLNLSLTYKFGNTKVKSNSKGPSKTDETEHRLNN